MEIKKLTEATIKEYGRIIQGDYFEPLLEKMQRVEYPAEGVEYVMSSEELEEEAVKRKVEETIYGGVPVQIGYCIGKNKSLNALEYHRSPEINIAVDDMILLLGRLQDVEGDFSYDTSRLEAFYVPAGTAVELYATTLHYVPCAAKEDTFRSTIVSIIAMYLQVMRYTESWIMWIFTNLISIVLWLTAMLTQDSNNITMLLMWSAYLVNSTYGYINWKKLEAK